MLRQFSFCGQGEMQSSALGRILLGFTPLVREESGYGHTHWRSGRSSGLACGGVQGPCVGITHQSMCSASWAMALALGFTLLQVKFLRCECVYADTHTHTRTHLPCTHFRREACISHKVVLSLVSRFWLSGHFLQQYLIAFLWMFLSNFFLSLVQNSLIPNLLFYEI